MYEVKLDNENEEKKAREVVIEIKNIIRDWADHYYAYEKDIKSMTGNLLRFVDKLGQEYVFANIPYIIKYKKG